MKTEIMLVFNFFQNKLGKMTKSAIKYIFCDKSMIDLKSSHVIKSVIYWINWFSCFLTIMLDEV